MDEIKDTLFSNNTFLTRFVNEEVRNSDIYAEGSEVRRLATLKELFATHLSLLWMSVKTLRAAHGSDEYTEEQKDKLTQIADNVKSLTSNNSLIAQIMDLANSVLESDNGTLYNFEQIEDLLNNFENDTTTADDELRLKNVQRLYSVIQTYFMRKAGVTKLPQESDSEEEEVNNQEPMQFS